jgi:hypothetical protein
MPPSCSREKDWKIKADSERVCEPQNRREEKERKIAKSDSALTDSKMGKEKTVITEDQKICGDCKT